MYYADESGILHKSVYSSDGKKLGFVKKVFADTIVIQSEFTWLRKYAVPRSMILSISMNKQMYFVDRTYSKC